MSMRTREWNGWRIVSTRCSISIYTPERRVRVHAGIDAPVAEAGVWLCRDEDDPAALSVSVQVIRSYVSLVVTR